jgi:hypothetical protein
MGRQRLRVGDIQVGAPLPWDAFDGAGRLLLRRGVVVKSDGQLERLLHVGLYSDSPDPLVAHPPVAGDGRDRISVFVLLDNARTRMASLVFPGPSADAFGVRVLELAQDLQRACEIDLDAALASVLLARSLPYSVRQCCNSAVICEVVCRQLEWPPEKRLQGLAAALTMNLSILQLQDALYHQQQPLDEAQKSAIVAHPRAAVALLEHLGVGEPVWLNAVAQHHEALDGSGYPARLSGDTIGTEARLLAMADKYCAMISERAYRQGRPADAALRQMLLSHGKGLDTELAARLVRAVGIYPPGSAVELNNGEIGVVVKCTVDARHPVVRVVISADGRNLREFPKRLTSRMPFGVKAAVDCSRLGPEFDPVPLWHDSMVDKDL